MPVAVLVDVAHSYRISVGIEVFVVDGGILDVVSGINHSAIGDE